MPTPEQIEQFKRRWNAVYELIGEAVEDVTECGRHWQNNDAQWTRRAIHRAVFAAIEAIASSLKQHALVNTIGDEDVFTFVERSALQNSEFVVDDRGCVRPRGARITTLANIQLAFRCYARSIGVDYEFDRNSDGWKQLVRCVKVRDRITHPKTKGGYYITEPEAKECSQLWLWFMAQVFALVKTQHDSFERIVASVKGRLGPSPTLRTQSAVGPAATTSDSRHTA